MGQSHLLITWNTYRIEYPIGNNHSRLCKTYNDQRNATNESYALYPILSRDRTVLSGSYAREVKVVIRIFVAGTSYVLYARLASFSKDLVQRWFLAIASNGQPGELHLEYDNLRSGTLGMVH
jgi:hypothetical protein